LVPGNAAKGPYPLYCGWGNLQCGRSTREHQVAAALVVYLGDAAYPSEKPIRDPALALPAEPWALTGGKEMKV
jgi:hypothetical protein